MKDIVMEKDQKKVFDKFNDLAIARRDITKHSSKELPKYSYPVNELVPIFHPSKIQVIVSKIVEENDDTKSFWLQREDKEDFPPFQAGSYITLEVQTNGRIYKRPYSISSDTNALKEYRITIKKEKNGIVSNYMYYECKENDKFTIYGPFGRFHYSMTRDSSDVICLAGGSGITGVRSMIVDLLKKKKVSSIELVYGVKTVKDILWKEEFDDLTKKYKNFKVTYLLSEEKREDYPYGLMNEELLRNLNPEGKTFFVSGPVTMYQALNEIFIDLDIPNKFIRYEAFREKLETEDVITYELTIHKQDNVIVIPCRSNQTLVQSMEEARLSAPVHCTVGVCGYCRSKLINGTVKTDLSGLRKKDVDTKYIHPCVTYPLSDVEIELP